MWHVTARVLPSQGVAALSVANHFGRGQPANHAMVEALTALYARA